jgi:hypothetical protein
MISSGIETTNFRLVAQNLSQLRQSVYHSNGENNIFCVDPNSILLKALESS